MPEDEKTPADKPDDKSGLPPWLEPVPGDEKAPGMPRLWMLAGGIVIVLVFTVLVWFMYDRTVSSDGAGIPLVKAPEGPVKIAPEDQGGMDIADQDKMVFDPIAGESEDRPETMQEGPEDPVERTPAPIEERTDIVPPPAETAQTSQQAPQQTAEKTPAQPAVAAGSHLLQLGAFRSEDAAANGWQRLAARYPQLFAGLDPDIERADLGERGVFYRLRGGPFDGRDSAERACQSLKASGEACIVVAR